MKKKNKEILKSLMMLTCADYMSNTIKLEIFKKEKIFNTKKLKIEFRNNETDELLHTIYLETKETINNIIK